MTDQDAPSERRLARAGYALLLLAIAVGYAQFGAVASLGEVAKRFGHAGVGNSIGDITGLSGSTFGVALAVLRLASLFALPLASLGDRWGRKKVIRRVAISALVLTGLASASPSFWTFVAFFAFARPLLTATSTLVSVVTVELATAYTRMRRVVLISAGFGIGSGLSAILHGLLPGADAFRYLFASAAVPALLVGPLLRRIPEPSGLVSIDPAHKPRLGAIPRALRRQMILVATLTAIVGVITGPANGFAFLYAENVLKISRHEVAFVVTFGALTGLGGLIIGGRLADRVGRRWTIALGVLATSLASVIAYSGGRSSFIFGFLAGVFAAALLGPAGTAWTLEIFPHHVRAAAAGWVVVAGVAGAIIGLLSFGVVSDLVHVSENVNAYRVPAVVTFLPCLPLLLLLRRLPESRGTEID